MKKEIKEEKENKHLVRRFLLIGLLIIIVLALWSRYVSTTGLIVKEYPIKTTNLSNDYDGLKIVHFSDLHYGSTVGLDEVKKLVKKINSLHPDIVVFTGDLVENKVVMDEDEINKLTKELQKINPVVETLAVIGNHDYDHNYWDLITAKLDWHILDNTYEYFYYNSKEPIVFVGLDDYLTGTPEYDNAFSYLNEIEDDYYTIVLAHQPDQVEEFKNYDFDLVLSGHSHLGQIRIPFIGALYTPIGAKKYFDEHYKINNADMYISGGIGTSTLRMRFFNKPSINLYRFYTK